MSIRAATETITLGRYTVVKRLASGGMADVLLARTVGLEGFERHVVIKRIHAELVGEPRYVKMLLDEARLVASLHHQNIVQVNDVGCDGEYFLAMEYVHGEDARQILVEATNRGETIPLQHVITIVLGAAAGLHHAHEKRGPDRKPLGIVHRDVSPPNILVGYDGSVKVTDFGIARAAHRAEQTQGGVLKGKAAYMSPEQCNAETTDRRSDVFSLGIVLYELLTVEPCFRGANEMLTMKAIVDGIFLPPSSLRPDIPRELEAIVMKALSTRPADRYPTADAMRMALEAFADHAGLRTTGSSLAAYLKKQFGERPEPWLEEDDLAIAIEGPASPVPPHRTATTVAGDARPRRRRPSTPMDEWASDAPTLQMAGLSPQEAMAKKLTLPLRALRPPTPIPHRHAVTASLLPRARAGSPGFEEVSAPRRRLGSHGESRVAPPTAPTVPMPLVVSRSRRIWFAVSLGAVVLATIALLVVARFQ